MADNRSNSGLNRPLTKNEKWDIYHKANALFGKGRQGEISTGDLVISIEMASLAGQPRLARHYAALIEARESEIEAELAKRNWPFDSTGLAWLETRRAVV